MTGIWFTGRLTTFRRPGFPEGLPQSEPKSAAKEESF